MAAEGAAGPARHVTARQDGCLPLVRLRVGAPGAARPVPLGPVPGGGSAAAAAAGPRGRAAEGQGRAAGSEGAAGSRAGVRAAVTLGCPGG